MGAVAELWLESPISIFTKGQPHNALVERIVKDIQDLWQGEGKYWSFLRAQPISGVQLSDTGCDQLLPKNYFPSFSTISASISGQFNFIVCSTKSMYPGKTLGRSFERAYLRGLQACSMGVDSGNQVNGFRMFQHVAKLFCQKFENAFEEKLQKWPEAHLQIVPMKSKHSQRPRILSVLSTGALNYL